MRRSRAAALLLPLALVACGGAEPEAPTAPAPPESRLRAVSFADLDGWQLDDPGAALVAFRRSCASFAARPATERLASDPAIAPLAGTIEAWRGACAAANGPAAPEQARAFFEDWFQPYLVSDRDQAFGLFTGYYEPLLHGSRHHGGPYTVPLYRAPDDLVRVDLGRFKPDLAGQTIAGRLDGSQLVPYYARAEIDAGALAGRDLELVWVDDPIDKFFLQVQGSGQVQLDDGTRMRVGYAGQNGHRYHAIGRDLVALGAMTIDEVSLQSIRDWLAAHPEQAGAIMARNDSYVFFRERPELDAADGPIGAQGVPLTAGRSLAVDARYIPLGAPVWLETTAPWPEGDGPLRRLMVAQDSGGAIRGPVRGDVFWGTGARAEAIAGRMRSEGRYVVLLPKAAIPTS
ncbi:MAG TPA: MltA domain-containing protein [Geminicoccaceae bacterium]|nr:MltA domain-containing protein [Geminicoccaceae bacterium]